MTAKEIQSTKRSVLTALLLFQFCFAPLSGLAQNETSDSEALKNRKLRAETEAAEAAARKAEADAAKVRSDIAKQDIETRKAQLEALRSTTTTEGSLVENNIAASKALGCAAINIASEIRKMNPEPDLLLMYNAAAADGLSQYSALMTQIRAARLDYDGDSGAIKSVLDRLEQYVRDNPAVSQAEIEALQKKVEEAQKAIDDLAKPKAVKTTGARRKRANEKNAYVLVPDKIVVSESNAMLTESDKKAIAEPMSFISPASPFGASVTAALTLLAGFRTDVNLKGTEVKADDQALMGYMFRTLKLTTANGKVFPRPDAPELISTADVLVGKTDTAGSPLLNEFRALAISYFKGKQASEAVAAKRKEVIKKAEVKHGKEAIKDQIKLETVVLENVTKALAEDLQNPLKQAQFKKAQLALELSNLRLENVQKLINDDVRKFDDSLRDDVARLESLNQSTEAMAKLLSGSGEKNTASLETYLRSELISTRLQKAKNPMWILASVSSNGSNQMRKSSLIFDIFTRGPMTSYSGGSVVNYQLRKTDGEVKLAGTIWSFAPYTKSSKIMEFKCEGIGEREKPTWMSL